MTARFLCIHGHFYQPPREDPWSGIHEAEPSAAPYHNWNERIYNECYGPMASSAILCPEGRVDKLVNNYRDISFNFGPTLLSWLERRHPDTYQAVLAADAASVKDHGGHGNAIAQCYNHIIMPLASERDRRTQIRWGLREFELRFGRRSEGLWLPETAVDSATLEALISEGVRFTILSPLQAARVKPQGGGWQPAEGDSFDSTQAYLWRSKRDPSKSIALFFYHRKLSQGVAFERMLNDGARFREKIEGSFGPAGRPQLIHLATDGESYGHHHQFGNMALAFTLDKIRSGGGIKITNYGEFLSIHPPTAEVELHEPSAWSCSHGVGRWSEDCGCASGANAAWKQRWRAPLRAALDWLARELDAFYEEQARRWIPGDPWAARDAAIDGFLDPGRSSAANRVQTSLLELQRERLFMYTSCGWFFDDISGIESQIILRHAARAIELARALGHEGIALERGFLERLALCPSNIPEHKDGARVYEKLVLPLRSRPIFAMAEASERDALQQRIYYQLKSFVASPSSATLKSILALIESANQSKLVLHWWEFQRVFYDWARAEGSSYHRLPSDMRQDCAALQKLLNLNIPSPQPAA